MGSEGGVNLDDLFSKPEFSEVGPRYDRSKSSLAVLAYNDDGKGCVLWTVGAHVRMEMEEGGLWTLEELGLEPPEPGIWIWEGKYIYSRCGPYGEDCETDPKGEFRQPTDEEWKLIREGCCPWNDEDWKIK